MRAAFTHVAAALSRGIASPWAIISANTLVVSGLLILGVDVTNVAISVFTMDVALVIQNTQNRDSAALHAKLDALIEASSAGDELERIEDEPEDEIERRRP